MLTKITAADYDAILNYSDKPVLIYFHDTFSGVGMNTRGLILSVAEEMNEKVDAFELDIEDTMELAPNLKLRILPMTYLFAKGKFVQRIFGYMKREQFITMLDWIIPNQTHYQTSKQKESV